MAKLTIDLLYSAFFLLGAGFCAWFVRSGKLRGKANRQWKKAILYACAAVLLGQGVYHVYNAIGDHRARRVPSSEEIGAALAENGSLAADDILYRSPDGYEVLIPAGFRYLATPGELLSLVARLEEFGVISVSTEKMTGTFRNDTDAILKSLSNTERYTLISSGPASGYESGAVQAEFAIDGGQLAKCQLVLLAKGGKSLMLMIVHPAQPTDDQQRIFDATLASFRPTP